jgi:hypothetical protein
MKSKVVERSDIVTFWKILIENDDWKFKTDYEIGNDLKKMNYENEIEVGERKCR